MRPTTCKLDVIWVILISSLLGLLLEGVNTYIQDDLQIPVDRAIPRIRPLRRQIRNFRQGKTGHITVVYQTTHPNDSRLRWFREADNLPNAELPGYLTTEGDPRYSLRFLSVNDVNAITLKVSNVRDSEFPMKFALVITAGSPAIEYQLYTTIDEASRGTQSHTLDEIRWVALPGTPLTFGYNGFLSITCVAVLDSESEYPHDDELQVYRMTFEKERFRQRKGSSSHGKPIVIPPIESEIGSVESTGLGQIHKARNNYAEEAGAYMTIGSRSRLPLKYFRYEVTRRIKNATRIDEGRYACGLERVEDRCYASSWVREGHPHRRPALSILPCENKKVKSRSRRRPDSSYHYKIMFSLDRETCIRCRAYGYPQPAMRITKNGNDVETDVLHDVDEHVNVADGGLQEITLTMRRPAETDAGIYECQAIHNKGVEKVRFKLERT